MKTAKSVSFAVFKKGELALEYDVATECWCLIQRMVRDIPPDVSQVERTLGDDFSSVEVRDMEMVEAEICLCVISNQAESKRPERISFRGKESIGQRKLNEQAKKAILLNAIQDRFL